MGTVVFVEGNDTYSYFFSLYLNDLIGGEGGRTSPEETRNISHSREEEMFERSKPLSQADLTTELSNTEPSINLPV